MNKFGYALGVFLRATYSMSLILFCVTIIIVAYILRPEPCKKTIAPVVIIENGKPGRLACDYNDGQFRAVAIIAAQELAQSILAAGSDATKYRDIVKRNAARIQDGSEAAGSFGAKTKENLEKMSVQKLIFEMEPAETKATASDNRREYYVSLRGRQVVEKAQGTTSRNIEFNVTLQFSDERGQTDENIFKVIKFTEHAVGESK